MTAFEKFLRWRFGEKMRKKAEAERRFKEKQAEIRSYTRLRDDKYRHNETRRSSNK